MMIDTHYHSEKFCSAETGMSERSHPNHEISGTRVPRLRAAPRHGRARADQKKIVSNVYLFPIIRLLRGGASSVSELFNQNNEEEKNIRFFEAAATNPYDV
jgi:hypothetical protein